MRQAAEQQLELRKSAAIYPAIPPSARGLSTRGPPDEPPDEPPDGPMIWNLRNSGAKHSALLPDDGPRSADHSAQTKLRKPTHWDVGQREPHGGRRRGCIARQFIEVL